MIQLGLVERLSPACPVTGRRGPQVLAADMGFLQVELSFVQETQRIKVNYLISKCDVTNTYRSQIMIRKGQQLKMTSNVGGVAEFYVICTLLRNGEALAYKETRPALGSNPTWNQAFLFYLDEGEPHEYWCQLLLMKGNRLALHASGLYRGSNDY